MKILLLAVMVALLPLRSIAAAITVFCPAQQIPASHLQAPIEAAQQGHNNEASGCSMCDAQCPSGAFVSDSARPAIMARFADSRTSLVECSALAFVTDQLDRPPLPLAR